MGLLIAAGPVSSQTVDYEGGVSLMRGAFVFADPTTSWALSTGLSLSADRLFARVTLPVYYQNSALVAGSGAGRIPTGGSSSGAVADSGRTHQGGGGDGGGMRLRSTGAPHGGPVEVPPSAHDDYTVIAGDPVAQLGWRLVTRPGVLVNTSISAKAPVTDTTAAGTGEWDVGVSLGVGRSIGTWGGVTLEASYWRLGDMPTLELRDPLQGSVGVFAFLGEGWAGGATVAASTTILEGYDPPVSAGITLSRVSAQRTIGVSAGVGLTETSPQFFAGLSWSFRIAE